MTTINQAITAYSKTPTPTASGSVLPKPPGSDDDGSAGGVPSFGTFVRQQASQAVTAMQKAEELSMLSIAGKADPIDVVTAVQEAETTLRTMTQIRDRLVQSVREVFSMNI